MSLLTLENPVFAVYVIAASLSVLKLMLQGWMTIYRMKKSPPVGPAPRTCDPGR